MVEHNFGLLARFRRLSRDFERMPASAGGAALCGVRDADESQGRYAAQLDCEFIIRSRWIEWFFIEGRGQRTCGGRGHCMW